MSERAVRAGVVGAGYWGPNLIRNLAELPGSPLAAVCDRDAARLEYVRARYPGAAPLHQSRGPAGRPRGQRGGDRHPGGAALPDGAAGPGGGEARLRGEAPGDLQRPVPGAGALAQARGLTLMVGHTFLHNDALRWVKQKADAGDLGDVLYLYSRRLNLGQVRQDINVVWNLAPHDVSIMLYLAGRAPPAGGLLRAVLPPGRGGGRRLPDPGVRRAAGRAAGRAPPDGPHPRLVARSEQGARGGGGRLAPDGGLRRRRPGPHDPGLRQGGGPGADWSPPRGAGTRGSGWRRSGSSSCCCARAT